MEHKFSGSFTCVNELTFALSGTQAAGTSIIQYRLSLAAERSEDKIYRERRGKETERYKDKSEDIRGNREEGGTLHIAVDLWQRGDGAQVACITVAT